MYLRPWLLLIPLCLVGCAQGKGRTEQEEIVAIIGELEIPAEELRAALRADYKERPGASRDPGAMAANRARVLSDLVDRRLLEQTAAERGIKVSPREVERALETLRHDYPGESFDKFLAEEGVSLEEVMDRTRRQLLIEKFFAVEVFARVAVTDDEIDDWLEANPGVFDRPAEVRALQLVVKTEEEAKELHAKLRAGEDFEALAREHSLSPDAKVGGDLGWFAEGEMPPPFDEVCFSLGVGRISEVVGSSFGFHLFKVLEKRAARSPDEETLRAEAESRLRGEKEVAAQLSFLENLRAGTSIRIDEAAAGRVKVFEP